MKKDFNGFWAKEELVRKIKNSEHFFCLKIFKNISKCSKIIICWTCWKNQAENKLASHARIWCESEMCSGCNLSAYALHISCIRERRWWSNYRLGMPCLGEMQGILLVFCMDNVCLYFVGTNSIHFLRIMLGQNVRILFRRNALYNVHVYYSYFVSYLAWIIHVCIL